MKALGDRMKIYEDVSRYHLTRRTPIIVRVDGRAFHTLLRRVEKPFDTRFITTMMAAATHLASEMQGFKLAYVQSDEASFLLTDYDKIGTQGWFNYNLAKMVSVSASLMSVIFNIHYSPGSSKDIALFDSRVFNIPREDVANYFLWRAKDWQRNSLSMYARSFFSHKQLMNKCNSTVHEMLHDMEKNWTTDLTDRLKNGSWLVKDQDWRHDILPLYSSIREVVDPLVELEEKS